jgi:hypothetical protein
MNVLGMFNRGRDRHIGFYHGEQHVAVRLNPGHGLTFGVVGLVQGFGVGHGSGPPG